MAEAGRGWGGVGSTDSSHIAGADQAHGGAMVVSDKAGKVVWGQAGVMFSLHENEEYEPRRRNIESILH